MIIKKMYCKACGKRMRKEIVKEGDKTLIFFTCRSIRGRSGIGVALDHDQEVYELKSERVMNC